MSAPDPANADTEESRMTQTHDAETVERVAAVMWESRNGTNFEDASNTALVTIYRDLARAALSAMPAQEVTVQEAAKVLLEADDYMPRSAKIAAVKAHTLREGKVRPATVVEGFRAALRALSEKEQ